MSFALSKKIPILAIPVVAASMVLIPPLKADAVDPCTPAQGATFICTPGSPLGNEDFAPLYGTKWVMGSGVNFSGGPGYNLHIYNKVQKTVATVAPSDITYNAPSAPYEACPRQGVPTSMNILGLAASGPDSQERYKLYATHSTSFVSYPRPRDFIEVFSVDTKNRPLPKLTSIGCVSAPTATPAPPSSGHFIDSVAPLPNGGLIATSLGDLNDPDVFTKLATGQPIGNVFVWTPGSGWSDLPGTAGTVSGPNGVLVSPNGKTVYVTLNGTKELLRISYGPGAITQSRISFDFTPDNIRWSPNGNWILLGGTKAVGDAGFNCLLSTEINCNADPQRVPFTVGRVNPSTLAYDTLIEPNVYGVMGGGTGAVKIGNELWISSYHSDRIAIFPYPRGNND